METLEPVIDARLTDWLERAHQHWCSEPEDCTAFDIGRRIQFLTVDVITQVCLGKELGCVATDSDRYDFLATVQRGNAVCQYFSVLLELNSLLYWLARLPVIGALITPRPGDKSGVGRIMGVSLFR